MYALNFIWVEVEALGDVSARMLVGFSRDLNMVFVIVRWLAFAIDAHSFGSWVMVVLLLLSGSFLVNMLLLDSNVPGSDVDVAFLSSVNLPSAAGLEPGNSLGLLTVEVFVPSKALDDDLVSNGNKELCFMFANGFDPMFFESPFPASWDDIILFGNLLELPNFELVNVTEKLGNLVEGIIPTASLDGKIFFEFGGFCGALAA